MNTPTNDPINVTTAAPIVGLPTSAQLWGYRTELGHTAIADLVGYQVVASDGEIGHIDEASEDAEGSAIIVDTGFWIFGKKRMIPAGVIDRIDASDRTVTVRLTKHDVKNAPDFVGDTQQNSPDPQAEALRREDHVAYYSRCWS